MIGERLKQLRNQRNITLSELGKVLNVAPMTISRYENNLREPDLDTLKEIADYFEVDVDFLMERTNLLNSKAITGTTLQIPLYKSDMNFDLNAPIGTYEILSSAFDFILDSEKVIAYRVLQDRYNPLFIPGDLFIIELTETVNSYSPYYLANLNNNNYILQMIGTANEHIFTYVNLESKPILKDITIIGRVIAMHRFV